MLTGSEQTFLLVLSTVLAVLMQGGYAAFHAGAARRGSAAHTVTKTLIDVAASGVCFWLVGRHLMGVSDDPARMAYHLALASLPAAIVAGATAERMRLHSALLVTLIVSAIAYPLFGHWAWGAGGWLGQSGFTDVGGAVVTHGVGAWVALGALLVLGPRGSTENGAAQPAFIPHDCAQMTLGGALVSVGLIGLGLGANALTGTLPTVALGNSLAMAAFAVMTVVAIRFSQGSGVAAPELLRALLGALVAAAAGAGQLSGTTAAISGAVSAILVMGGYHLIAKLAVDDATGAIAIHGIGGAWGTVAVALFAPIASFGTASRSEHILIQLVGIAAAAAWGLAIGFGGLKLLSLVHELRVSSEEEDGGLDRLESGFVGPDNRRAARESTASTAVNDEADLAQVRVLHERSVLVLAIVCFVGVVGLGSVALQAVDQSVPITVAYAVFAVTGLVMIVQRLRALTHQLELKIRALTQQGRALEAVRTKSANAMKMASLGAMAGGLAHEINNPLSIIKGYGVHLVKMLDSGTLNPETLRHIAQKIEGTSDRIARVIQGLKDFSREGSSDPLKEESFEIVLGSALAFCRAKYESEGIRIDTTSVALGLKVWCRATQLSQVLFGLLTNAYDAVKDRDEKWIRITAFELNDAVRIAVMDSGKGIEAGLADRLWEPFFTTKGTGKGTGLGLSVAKGLVESHGGELSLDAASPDTCFVIRLPKTPGAALANLPRSA